MKWRVRFVPCALAGVIGLAYLVFVSPSDDAGKVFDEVPSGTAPGEFGREPFISASLAEQWEISPDALGGMDGLSGPAPQAPAIGSTPRLDGGLPPKYEEGLFDEVIESSGHRVAGLVLSRDESPMCYLCFSSSGELQWMAHRGAFYNRVISVGNFSEGLPHDGFFLMDLHSGKIIVDPDTSHYFSGRDLRPDLGLLELIDGKVVGMIHLYDPDAIQLIDRYISTQPEIRNCLDSHTAPSLSP
ncbi:MAG: hypothetical protein AAFX06_10340 [Planctomycetota bacterium]